MTFAHVAAFLAGCIIGAVTLSIYNGCVALHRAVRKAMIDLRP